MHPFDDLALKFWIWGLKSHICCQVVNLSVLTQVVDLLSCVLSFFRMEIIIMLGLLNRLSVPNMCPDDSFGRSQNVNIETKRIML